MSTTPGPWPARGLVILVGSNAVAAVMLVVAWAGAADTPALRDQLGWLNLAVLAGVLSAATDASWLLAGRRAVGQRRRRLLPDVIDSIRSSATATVSVGVWLWVPGTRRAHRAGCSLAAGKGTIEVDAARIRSEQLHRCELCGSDVA